METIAVQTADGSRQSADVKLFHRYVNFIL